MNNRQTRGCGEARGAVHAPSRFRNDALPLHGKGATMRKNASIRFRPVERSILRRAGERVGLGWTTFAREAALLRAHQILAKGEDGGRNERGELSVVQAERIG